MEKSNLKQFNIRQQHKTWKKSNLEQLRSYSSKSKVDVYALIWSGDWLSWLESMHLRHQFSEIFSILFMRMNSYDPITVLFYAWGCITMENSNLMMKELPCCQFTSVNMIVTIFNSMWSAHERAVSALSASTSLTTLGARIISSYLDWRESVSNFVNIFHILSCSEHEPAQCMRTYKTSLNERCANKDADTAVRLIMHAITW